jgi:hypothetical protein
VIVEIEKYRKVTSAEERKGTRPTCAKVGAPSTICAKWRALLTVVKILRNLSLKYTRIQESFETDAPSQEKLI